MQDYYGVGCFVRDKEGKIFRITGIVMEGNGEYKYSIIPIHLDPDNGAVINGERISNYEKL